MVSFVHTSSLAKTEKSNRLVKIAKVWSYLAIDDYLIVKIRTNSIPVAPAKYILSKYNIPWNPRKIRINK